MKVKKQYNRLDAGQSAFFARQLEFVKGQVYEVEYAKKMARTLFPVSFEGGPGIDTITYRMFDRIGMAKIVANYAKDIPRADVFGKEFTAKVRELASSYGYSIKEIRRAAQAGLDLNGRKAMAAKEAIMDLEDQIAFVGDSNFGLYGLLSHPNTNSATIAADGATSATTFASKDADKIIRDLNILANDPSEKTQGVEKADTLLLPVAQFNQIATTRLGTYNDKTILRFFLDNSPYVKNVFAVPALKGAGANSVDVAVAYARDPMKLELAVPSDFEQLPEQEEGLEIVVPCLESFAGVIMYRPMSVSIGLGV